MKSDQNDSPDSAPARGQLRILQTTDLHMQLLDFDYFANLPDDSTGLTGLADVIAALQADKTTTTILCDTGDLIQGNPLADYLAANLREADPHPMVQALNLLGYAALTLGNHDFDYGLDVLGNALRRANFPVVSANLQTVDQAAFWQPFALLTRQVRCTDGQHRDITLGITGFAPPVIADWVDATGKRAVFADDIVAAANRVVPQMQRTGADLVIALCHSGIGPATHTAQMENAAVPLAAIDGVDVILAGHTHEVFPDPNRPATKEIDPVAGTLHGKPAVMAGSSGKSLGVIDLELVWQDRRWRIDRHRVRLEPAAVLSKSESPLRQQLRRLVSDAHARTTDLIGAPIARTTVPITSFFATVQPDTSQQLLALAMQKAARTALAGTPAAAYPVLAATSPFRFGGRSGFGHYVNIPPGPVTLRDATAIFPFADRVCAVYRTGAQLRSWLEQSASYYCQITAGQTDQPLLDPLNPGYNCDTLFGLHYEIDLTQPARFGLHGGAINPAARRITDLRFHGAPVKDTDRFVVATTSFRTKGGGGFPAISGDDRLYTSPQTVRELLISYLAETAVFSDPTQPVWRFKPIAASAATFQSSPLARDHISGPIIHIGAGLDGFDTYRITF